MNVKITQDIKLSLFFDVNNQLHKNGNLANMFTMKHTGRFTFFMSVCLSDYLSIHFNFHFFFRFQNVLQNCLFYYKRLIVPTAHKNLSTTW